VREKRYHSINYKFRIIHKIKYHLWKNRININDEILINQKEIKIEL
jgi:hypothetical protein